jgi:hypothetical protein
MGRQGAHTPHHAVFVRQLALAKAVPLAEGEDGAQLQRIRDIGVDVEEEREVLRDQ